jgi:aldose 1-epimerase
MKLFQAVITFLPAVFASIAELHAANPGLDPIPVGPDGKYTIVADGIRAQFIPYGASLMNLFVNDSRGIERDVVLGYDDAGAAASDPKHPHMGGVPGRYANRIKNGTFVMKDKTFQVPTNENNGADTLHGGPRGWDYRNFEVVQYTRNIIVFKMVDQAGEMGFPGTVTAYITYGVTLNKWHIYMNATSTAETPIMLTSHVYWNLDGFQSPFTNQIFNHTLEMPFSGQRLDVDGILVPTGFIAPNYRGSANDFYSRPKSLAQGFSEDGIDGNCGTNCKGYDTCYTINRVQFGPQYFQPLADGSPWYQADPVASLWSEWSGIQVNVFTDQDAFQLYSCNGQDGESL